MLIELEGLFILYIHIYMCVYMYTPDQLSVLLSRRPSLEVEWQRYTTEPCVEQQIQSVEQNIWIWRKRESKWTCSLFYRTLWECVSAWRDEWDVKICRRRTAAGLRSAVKQNILWSNISAGLRRLCFEDKLYSGTRMFPEPKQKNDALRDFNADEVEAT